MPPAAGSTTAKRINRASTRLTALIVPGEIKDVQDPKNLPEGCVCAPSETNKMLWTATLAGPPGSVYEGGEFEVSRTCVDPCSDARSSRSRYPISTLSRRGDL